MKSFLGGAVLASSIIVATGAGSPASALSCVMPEAVLSQAPTIFTGRIVERDDEKVVIQVAEVWKGAPVPRRATYDVELAGWWDASMRKVPGHVRVFAPMEGRVGPCTSFAFRGPEAVDLLEFRPAAPAAPTSAAPRPIQPAHSTHERRAGVDDAWTWLAAGGAAAMLLGLFLGTGRMVRRGRRP